MPINYWLMKSEPNVFSIEDLADSESQTTFWDGVRNYQARNYMRDEMKKGDFVLFYHSNAKPPGVAGIAKVVSEEAYPDHSAFDKNDKHFDPKSDPENPRWMMVDIQFVEAFNELLPLPLLKEKPELEGLELLRKGSRLSIQPVSKEHFQFIKKLGKTKKR